MMPATMPHPDPSLPIGVFDSGVGGLTVLAALRRRLPAESLIYLGDTARLPYGTKSPDTVRRYAVQAAGLLVARGIKALVVACNTATAHALPHLQQAFAGIPVIGVLEPGAAAAVAASGSGRIVVIATESTVQAGAYEQAILRLRPEARVIQKACPLFVALAEEGLVDGEIARSVARHYLEPLFGAEGSPDTLVLGCTHFPALSQTIAGLLPGVALIDSAHTTAAAVAEGLYQAGLARAGAAGTVRYLATDAPERFGRVAETFLKEPIAPETIELVDLS